MVDNLSNCTKNSLSVLIDLLPQAYQATLQKLKSTAIKIREFKFFCNIDTYFIKFDELASLWLWLALRNPFIGFNQPVKDVHMVHPTHSANSTHTHSTVIVFVDLLSEFWIFATSKSLKSSSKNLAALNSSIVPKVDVFWMNIMPTLQR